jgi:NAD(P)-dependent dehydrogenase (short-subunit alcohol dehydrogenase family)
MLCDLSPDAVARTAGRSDRLWAVTGDAADPASVAAMSAGLVARWGDPDVLVNNVGISGPTAWVEDISLEAWEATLRTNLTAAFLWTRQLAPAMKRMGRGSIVNISSVAGRLGFPLRLPYAATKWGIIGMTETLAMELGPFGVAVNAILPGLVENERADRILTAQAEAQGVSRDQVLAGFLSRISMRTRVTPEEVAGIVSYLCSPLGRHISGQQIGVCGNFETYANPTPQNS